MQAGRGIAFLIGVVRKYYLSSSRKHGHRGGHGERLLKAQA